MSCENRQLDLLGHVDGDLPEASRRELLAHVETCPACREELRALEAALGSLRESFTRVAPPADLTDRVLAEISTPAPEVRVHRLPLRRALQRPWIAAGLAAAVLLFAALPFLLAPGGPAGLDFPVQSPHGYLAVSDAGDVSHVTAPESRVPSRSRLVSLPGSYPVVTLGDHATARLDPLTRLNLGDRANPEANPEIDHGVALVEVTDPRATLDLHAGPMAIQLEEGVFEVEVDPRIDGSTILRAHRGTARVTLGDDARELAEGGQLLVTTGTSPREVVMPIDRALSDRESRSATGVVLPLDGDDPREGLVALTRAETGDHRDTALVTLLLVDADRAAIEARRLLRSGEGDDRLRRAAIDVLERIGNDEDLGLLTATVENPERDLALRLAALDAIATARPDEDLSGLAGSLPPTQAVPELPDPAAVEDPARPALGRHPGQTLKQLALGRRMLTVQQYTLLEDAAEPDPERATQDIDDAIQNNEMAFSILAARAGGAIRDTRLAFFLRRLLRSNEPSLWLAALATLREVSLPELSPEIARVLRRSTSYGIPMRRKLTASVGGATTAAAPDLLPLIEELYDDEADPTIRGWLLVAAQEIETPAAADFFLRVVENDESPALRETGLVELAHRRDPRAVEHARLGLLSDGERRTVALQVATLLEDRRLFAQLLTSFQAPVSSPLQRRQAAVALGKLRDSRATNHLLQATGVRGRNSAQEIGRAIGLTTGPDTFSDVIRVLGDASTTPWMKTGILYGLRTRSEIPDPDSLLNLLPGLLRSENPHVVEAAAMVARSLAHPALAPPLHELLTHRVSRVRIQAARALQAIGDGAGVDHLLQAIASPNEAVVRQALRALEDLIPGYDENQRRRVARHIVEGLPHFRTFGGELHLLALRILVILQENVDPSTLRPGLEDPDLLPIDRMAVALVLSQQGVGQAVVELRGYLTQPLMIEALIARLSPYVREDVDRAELIESLHAFRLRVERDLTVDPQLMIDLVRRALLGRLIGDIPTVSGTDPDRYELFELSREARLAQIQDIDALLQSRATIVRRLGNAARSSQSAIQRRRAVVRLGHVVSPQSIQALFLATTDPDPDVAEAAEQILTELGVPLGASEVEVRELIGTDPAVILRRYRNELRETLVH